MRLVTDMIAASTPSTLLCGGLWYFKKREAAQIIAFQTVANAFACLAQLWLLKNAGRFQSISSPGAKRGVPDLRDTIRSNDWYIEVRSKALKSRISTATVSGILLAVAAQAVKSKRTMSAKQLALPIVAMSVLSLLGSQSNAQLRVQQQVERAFMWAQNLSGLAIIGIICYRRWGFR